MAKEIVLDKWEMIDALNEGLTLRGMCAKFGHNFEVIQRWAKLYTIIERGRERTIHDVILSRNKSTPKKQFSVDDIIQASYKATTMRTISRRLGCSYELFYKRARLMKHPNGENLVDVLKEQMFYNAKANYTRKYKTGK